MNGDAPREVVRLEAEIERLRTALRSILEPPGIERPIPDTTSALAGWARCREIAREALQ